MATWTVKADHRRADYASITQRLRALSDAIEGLSLRPVAPEQFHGADDGGDFRDFRTIAYLSHHRTEALEIIAEELIGEFGWVIDLSRNSD